MSLWNVKKRDGKEVAFDREKITVAIQNAFKATGEKIDNDGIEVLVRGVILGLKNKFSENSLVNVEDIQDEVEKNLIDYDYPKTAKAYILYRNKHTGVRNMNDTLMDYKKLVEGYMFKNDWRVKENSTATYSVSGLIYSNSGAVTANYWLNEIFDKDISDAHRNGDIHIHDLGMLAPYCAGWSLKQLLVDGICGVSGKTSSAPARHLVTVCEQMVNFIGILQNEWVG
jgi:ribonucleoside-triphosphate reductase